jgi:hypothetical protein
MLCACRDTAAQHEAATIHRTLSPILQVAGGDGKPARRPLAGLLSRTSDHAVDCLTAVVACTGAVFVETIQIHDSNFQPHLKFHLTNSRT